MATTKKQRQATNCCRCWQCTAGYAGRARRVIVESIDQATLSLATVDRDPVHAIHTARVSLKQARAVGRLLRPTDPARIGRDLAVMAEAGRLLAPIRDQHVARQVRDLREDGQIVPPPVGAGARLRTAQAFALLTALRFQVADHWQIGAMTDDQVLDGMTQAYRGARRSYRKLSNTTPIDHHLLHETRKKVKRAYYQAELLRAQPDPDRTDARLDRLEQLGDLLGHHRDLSQFATQCSHELTTVETSIDDTSTALFSDGPSTYRSWAAQLLAK